MRLLPQELRILKAIELNAGLSVAEIAHQSGLQSHSVTYYLAKLKTSGILGPRRPAIHTYRLGLSDFHFLFSISSGSAAKREGFVSAVKKSPSVVWFAEVGGSHQYALSIRVRQINEALAFMERTHASFPNMLRMQQLSVVSSVTSYGRQYLYGKRKAIRSFRKSFQDPEVVALDSTDYQILSGLSELEYSSERDLARLLGLPFTTVRRRIGLLEESGVIKGYFHHIDTAKLGYQTFKLLIFTRSQDAAFLRQLETFAASQDNIVHSLEFLGSWQNEFVVEVQEAAHASLLAGRIREQFDAYIETIQVIPLFRYFKATSLPGLSRASR